MIGRLTGILVEKQPPQLLLDVQGVGYEVQAPMSTFYKLPELNQQTQLLIHFVVREDAQLLYGFHTEKERALFRALIKVNGVGPKLALTILSGIEPEQFVHCIRSNDSSQLVCIPGIGKKTAERLIIETRDVLAKWELDTPSTQTENHLFDDAMSALAALGYKAAEAKRAVQAAHQPDMSSEDLIRMALRHIVQGA